MTEIYCEVFHVMPKCNELSVCKQIVNTQKKMELKFIDEF